MLIPTLFSTKYLTLSRMAGKIASRRIEILLTMNTKDVIEQISKEEITKLMSILETNKLIKKHPGFISLLNKLAIQHFNLPPLEFEHQRPFDPSTIRHVQIDQSWFLSQVGKISIIFTGVVLIVPFVILDSASLLFEFGAHYLGICKIIKLS